jgi:hypothetical protein
MATDPSPESITSTPVDNPNTAGRTQESNRESATPIYEAVTAAAAVTATVASGTETATTVAAEPVRPNHMTPEIAAFLRTICLIGTSGAGKTQTARLMSGHSNYGAQGIFHGTTEMETFSFSRTFQEINASVQYTIIDTEGLTGNMKTDPFHMINILNSLHTATKIHKFYLCLQYNRFATLQSNVSILTMIKNFFPELISKNLGIVLTGHFNKGEGVRVRQEVLDYVRTFFRDFDSENLRMINLYDPDDFVNEQNTYRRILQEWVDVKDSFQQEIMQIPDKDAVKVGLVSYIRRLLIFIRVYWRECLIFLAIGMLIYLYYQSEESSRLAIETLIQNEELKKVIADIKGQTDKCVVKDFWTKKCCPFGRNMFQQCKNG